jgi:hypothetical protein
MLMRRGAGFNVDLFGFWVEFEERKIKTAESLTVEI